MPAIPESGVGTSPMPERIHIMYQTSMYNIGIGWEVSLIPIRVIQYRCTDYERGGGIVHSNDLFVAQIMGGSYSYKTATTNANTWPFLATPNVANCGHGSTQLPT